MVIDPLPAQLVSANSFAQRVGCNKRSALHF
jgi:hypothetical protein